MSQPRSASPFPTRIGAWVPERLLGRGAIATVYLVRGESGRPGALKWLHDDHPALVRRFLRESRILSGLSHPSIVHWLDDGMHEGRPYLVMEHIEGSDLRVYAPKLHQRPPIERYTRVRAIGVALCGALAFLHERGLVHRDLKPSNVLIGEDERIVLTDFGVVRDLAESEQEAVGKLVGTPAYAAPEQRNAAGVDSRADLFGLGATLYFALTLQRPFAGISEADRAQVPAPSFIDPAVPEQLEAIVTRLMHADPAQRFPDATAVATELQAQRDSGVVIAGRQQAVAAAAEVLELAGRGQSVALLARGPLGAGKGWLAALVTRNAQRRGIPVMVLDDEADAAAARELLGRPGGALVVARVALELPEGVLWREVQLSPLGIADVRRTVVGIAPKTREPARVAARLHRLSGGLPGLLVPVLAKYLRDDCIELPEAVAPPTMVQRFLEGLDPVSQELLGVLSLQGRPTAEAVLDVVVGASSGPRLAALAERGLVREVDGRWDLAADFFAQAALDFVPEPAQLRVRIAAARSSSLDDPTVPGVGLSGMREDAEAALAEGRVGEALGTARRAAELAEAVGDTAMEAEVLCTLGQVQLDLGDPKAARRTLADASALARAADVDVARRLAHALRASADLDDRPGARAAAAAALDRLMPLVQKAGVGDAAEGMALATWSRAAAHLGDRGSWDRARRRTEALLPQLAPAQQARLRLIVAEGAVRLRLPDAPVLVGAAESAAEALPLLAWRARCLLAEEAPPERLCSALSEEQCAGLSARARPSG
jgi:tetratricopeptide (TPR) repeat protein